MIDALKKVVSLTSRRKNNCENLKNIFQLAFQLKMCKVSAKKVVSHATPRKKSCEKIRRAVARLTTFLGAPIMAHNFVRAPPRPR